MLLEITYSYTERGQVGSKHKALVVSCVPDGALSVKLLDDDLFLVVGEDGNAVARVNIPTGGRIVKVHAETSSPAMPVKYEDLRDPVFNEVVKPIKIEEKEKSTEDILANTALNLCETLSNLIAELIDKGIINQESSQALLDSLYKDRAKQ